MDIIWFCALAFLLVGYFALEGFDLGLGMLLPILGRTQEERDRIVAGMAPFVLANEVWLVAAVGVLFGAFPQLEGKALSGLYPLIVSLLVTWILRDAGLWFRRRLDGRRWRGFWDTVIAVASLGLSFTWGLAIAGMARGFPDDLADPRGLLLGALVAALFALHGWTFASWRMPGQMTGSRRTGLALMATGALAALPIAVPLAFMAPSIVGLAAPDETLNVLGLMVVPFTPLMIGAQVWVWRTFRPERAPHPSFF
ncbi:cytochrome d ubiquinol oxidase subunit II [Sinosporangium siamense]|uniref:Cytochrome bd oxidase subunit II n=1 Tax=Sinosporangium siamense TaxID=1367973 RepID=A0A919V7S7_9ACTN|nr:cytochrome d ubiquinol oxidase subunit II [Sinosporangium siamense]GII93738.1 cytochrome bd oxidase subunit II [Sinosporangium siamense]